MQHRAHIHQAHDAARALLFARHSALVHAAADHHPALVSKVEGIAARNLDIILGVQIILPGHSAGNAARVDVRVDFPRVDAVEHLALGIALGVLIGDILKQVGVTAGIFRRAGQRAGNLVELPGDGLNVLN